MKFKGFVGYRRTYISLLKNTESPVESPRNSNFVNYTELKSDTWSTKMSILELLRHSIKLFQRKNLFSRQSRLVYPTCSFDECITRGRWVYNKCHPRVVEKLSVIFTISYLWTSVDVLRLNDRNIGKRPHQRSLLTALDLRLGDRFQFSYTVTCKKNLSL